MMEPCSSIKDWHINLSALVMFISLCTLSFAIYGAHYFALEMIGLYIYQSCKIA